MEGFLFQFEWDPTKARVNFDKHGVRFEAAAEVFLDPLALTIPDDEHSESESRWITMGRDKAGQYVLVVHTFDEVTGEMARIRLISARRPTPAEIHAYEERP